MEFHCLWLTTTLEYSIWKVLLEHFPFPLSHKYYRNIKEVDLEVQCNLTSVCFWSEKEYSIIPKGFKNIFEAHPKPSILVVKKASFAVKAFERGFKNCLYHDDIQNKLSQEVINLLAYYFKPQSKPRVFREKLYIPADPEQNVIHFIEFKNVVRIYRKKGISTIEMVSDTVQTKIPFLWLTVQCKLPNLKMCQLSIENLINTHFIESIDLKNQQHQCKITNGKILKMSPKEHYRLQRYIKSIN